MVGSGDEVDIVCREVSVVSTGVEEEAGDAVWVVVWLLEVKFGIVAEVLAATSTSVSAFEGCGNLSRACKVFDVKACC